MGLYLSYLFPKRCVMQYFCTLSCKTEVVEVGVRNVQFAVEELGKVFRLVMTLIYCESVTIACLRHSNIVQVL